MELMGDLDVENAHCDGFMNNEKTLYADNFYTGLLIEGKLCWNVRHVFVIL